MIKVEAKNGCVAFLSDGNTLELAHEVLAIRQFLEENPEVEMMANVIEKLSKAETTRYSNPEELKKAQDKFVNSKHDETTAEMLNGLFGKKMN